MREHIRRIIDEAKRGGDPGSFDGPPEPSLRLAAETIRLARLAASAHMILAARMTAEAEPDPAEPLAARGRST